MLLPFPVSGDYLCFLAYEPFFYLNRQTFHFPAAFNWLDLVMTSSSFWGVGRPEAASGPLVAPASPVILCPMGPTHTSSGASGALS